ncbi:endonuclease VII [Escherichia phage 4MG]|uniref:EndoVII packaging and recombination endonuclease n=1 Tax=Escherichia phage 4MG TaxID=1391428 RepID=V5KSZ7_9CAUD|nr:endonuclease VII [Escherichia phage 4MG]AGZ17597.1 EndoVII packaging and recombination endonuclease [Escherichia phage 4MG]
MVPLTAELWVKDARQIAAFREKLILEQGGLDPVLGEPLRKPCLDHDHFDGKCRGVLSQCVNTFEGYVLKAWMKYVSAYTETSLSTALRNLADYLEQDFSGYPIHAGYKDDMLKFLRRCTNEKIIERAESDLGLIIPKGTQKHDSITLYLTEFVRQTEERFAE